jgi:hypothetical protein
LYLNFSSRKNGWSQAKPCTHQAGKMAGAKLNPAPTKQGKMAGAKLNSALTKQEKWLEPN